ncbi:DUF5343 domain-containing protein [Sphingomonas sp. HITSZ_GF]|uniref:DUF5343 domain-containing protein n=1 Tax=Sphingomonas sp. HITSZ_GF TaxID=3037247 RepID=UPI00240CF218|nr:DUF5343 domain-containing protein [Sphingomonas sp. HITSZ_GF]MDG2533544.1 DUF5343 domain-containing protein [Sphingomonas sp. HITSZ_GF]
MGLSSSWVGAAGRVPEVFNKIRDGQAPSQVTNQLLKDWGFSSSADRAFIPLLKSLGFLTPTGQPTQRYHDYRDHSRSKVVMGEALREAYQDIFLIKANPTKADQGSITGKFKSFHNASDDVAQRMSKTFFALLELADLSGGEKPKAEKEAAVEEQINSAAKPVSPVISSPALAGLHYNVQIHLPATKDVEVYNAIFKSLREHFVD